MLNLELEQCRPTSTSSKHIHKRHLVRVVKQGGFGLIEMLISMALSLLAITVMVVLMASTLGAGAKTIQMSRLSQELRSSH